MATFSTEGIIVKRSNFGEAGRLLTIVTPYKGKIKVLAKGVRRITSRRGGNVELLNLVKLQIFQGKGLSILTEAESIETFPKIKSNLLLSSFASHNIEIAGRLLPEDQPNPEAYRILISALKLLEQNPRQIFIRAFEIKFLTALGFWDVRGIGEIGEIRETLEKLQKNSWEEIAKMKLNKNQALELERILRYYIERILEGPLRSIKILEKLKNGK